MSLYHWINLLSISVPLLASFHPRIQLFRHWPKLFAAVFIVMVPYVIWDAYFTMQGYWGFNPAYLGDLYLFGLPLEEWLFFVCIPYACIFTHIAVLQINPNLQLSDRMTRMISLLIFVVVILLLVFNYDRAYTLFDTIFVVVILAKVYVWDFALLKSFYITFLFMLIPFFVVNGILTGSGIAGEIVWYNDQENLGIRLLTIPIEDVGYAFSMILANLFLYRKFLAFSKDK